MTGLRLAWVYRTGDYLRDRGRFEATPLVVDGALYVSTPVARVVALDPARGTERWTYDPRVSLEGDYGDFVLAFTLPGHGAPAPDTIPRPVEGAYVGDIRVGAARIGVTLTIGSSGDSLRGAITRIDSLEVTGPVAVWRSADGVHYRAPFVYRAKGCAGTINATGELWNGGGLLEGDVEVTGSCGGGGDRPPERGTFALRRQ